MKSTETNFKSHRFSEKINGVAITYRILKMQDSLFIYIGNSESENFDGLALGFISNRDSKSVISSSITDIENTESKEIAHLLSSRLLKPVFVSSSRSFDRNVRLLVEKRLIKEITDFPEHF